MNRMQGYSFPLKLKTLRLQAGMSQEELSKELGISRSCLANYETGKRQPDSNTITKIANVFHVMTDFLIDRPLYQDLVMHEDDLDKADRIKKLIREHKTSLDMSELDVEHRIALIEYHKFVMTMQEKQIRQQRKNA